MDSPISTLDDYEMRHLIAHLIAPEICEYAHELLVMETDYGRNAWFLQGSSLVMHQAHGIAHVYDVVLPELR